MSRTESSPRRPLVLCVDDEPPVLSALRRTLRNEPFDLITTEDAGQALEWLEEEEVDLLITDQRMPEMIGTDLLKAARRRRPAAASLILTGYPESVPKQDLARSFLIAKPWIDDELKRTVRNLIIESRTQTRRQQTLRRRQPSGRSRTGLSDLAEVLVRADCTGLGASAIMSQVLPILERHETARRGMAVVLDNLTAIEEPVAALIDRVESASEAWEVRTLILDRTGAAAGVLQSREAGGLQVCGPEALPRRVVIVSRNEETRNALETVLGSAGHRVRSSPSVEETLRLLQEPADVVILDLSLPDAEATEVASHARGSRVLGVSAWEDLWDEETRTRLGIERVLQKPIPLEELLEAVRMNRPQGSSEEEESAV